MADPDTASKQQQNGAAEKKSRAQRFTTFLERAKEKYKPHALSAYAKYKEWSNGPWWFQEKEPLNRFTGWLMAYTAVLVAVSSLQFCTLQNTDRTTRDAVIAANRAWLAPVSAAFEREPVVGQKMHVRLTYRNVGRAPALKFNFGMRIFGVPTGKSGEFTIPRDDFCNQVSFPGVNVVFPTQPPDHEIRFPFAAEAVFTPDMASGKIIPVWQACFRYETFGEPRKTLACYFLRTDGSARFWQSCREEAD